MSDPMVVYKCTFMFSLLYFSFVVVSVVVLECEPSAVGQEKVPEVLSSLPPGVVVQPGQDIPPARLQLEESGHVDGGTGGTIRTGE